MERSRSVGTKEKSVYHNLVSFIERACITFCNFLFTCLFAFAHCIGFQPQIDIGTTQRNLENSFPSPTKDQLNQNLWDWIWEPELLNSSQVILMDPQS